MRCANPARATLNVEGKIIRICSIHHASLRGAATVHSVSSVERNNLSHNLYYVKLWIPIHLTITVSHFDKSERMLKKSFHPGISIFGHDESVETGTAETHKQHSMPLPLHALYKFRVDGLEVRCEPVKPFPQLLWPA